MMTLPDFVAALSRNLGKGIEVENDACAVRAYAPGAAPRAEPADEGAGETSPGLLV